MAEHKIKTQEKQDKVEQKHRVRQRESQPVFDHFHAWEQGMLSMTETPFFPRMDEHAELLARAHSDEHRANIVLQLQQTYGNRYVQRLIESRVVQAKTSVSTPNDIYEQEADRVAKAVTRADSSQVQRQPEEDEEMLQGKASQLQRQPEEDEEMLQGKASQLQRQAEEEEEPLQTRPLLKRVVPTVIQGVGVQQRIRDPMTAGFYIQRAYEPGIPRKKGRVLDWITVKRMNVHVWLSALLHRRKDKKRELLGRGFGNLADKETVKHETEVEEGGKKEAKSSEWGHWWIELDTGGGPESYGWWPKEPVSNPFSSKNEGQLNQGDAEDPHHGDTAEQEFHPKLTRYYPWGDADISDEIRKFAYGYRGTWRWLFGWGKNCHTFQKSLMRAVGLKKP